MKDNKVALYTISLIIIGGLIASQSVQLGVIAFAQENDEVDEQESDEYDSETYETKDSDEYDYETDEVKEDAYREHKEIAEKYCSMTEEEKRQYLSEHDDIREYKEKIDKYCELDEADREKYLREMLKEYHDKYGDKAMTVKENLDRFCSLSNAEKEEFLAMHDKMTDEMREIHDKYCSMTQEERDEFRKQHQDLWMDFKEDHKMMLDEKRFGHDFVRDFDMRIATLCDMSEDEMKKLIQEHEFLREHHERIVNYCHMSEEERKEFRMTHQDVMEDYQEDFAAMRDKVMDEKKDMRMHAMMLAYDITDENKQRLVEKFMSKHSDLSDAKRSEIKEKIHSKFQNYYDTKLKMRHDKMSDLQRDQILKRIAEMRDYKSDLREKYQDMSEDERIKFQAEFRDKVVDKRFSWISPQKQMLAGVSVDDVECREGLNLVLKTSNGKALCLTSDTAERLIAKGIVIPPN